MIDQPYARTTDIAEIRRRASALTIRLYDYWLAHKGDRDLPSRADIDPAEMGDWLPGLMLVDVFYDPRRLKYRLVGEVEVESRGFNPTGRWVEEGFLGASLDDVLTNYNTAIDQRCALLDWSGFRCGGGYLTSRESLFLPLAGVDGRVEKVMTFSLVEQV